MSTARAPRPIVILISGRGGNMRAIIERSRAPGAAYAVVKVLSDQPAAPGLEVARSFGVAAQSITPPVRAGSGAGAGAEVRAAYDQSLADSIETLAPSLLVLAGFMRILSPDFVARFRGRILNIHPSLLPKFPGLHTHRRALEAHETEHGATVHFVTEQLDGGPPIIQARVPVRPDDDEERLAARVQIEEHRIYPLAVEWFCEDRLRFENGRAWLDGKALDTPLLAAQSQTMSVRR